MFERGVFSPPSSYIVIFSCLHVPLRASSGLLVSFGLQWNLHNTDTVGTSNCPYYRGVPTSEVSGIFPVGVAICIHAVEHFEELCVPVLVYNVQLVNQCAGGGAGQSCVRVLPASAIWSEFCTV